MRCRSWPYALSQWAARLPHRTVDDTSPPWQTWILLGLLRDRPPTCAKSPSRLWQAWRLSAASHATYLGGLRSRIGAPLGRSVHASVTPFSTTKINSFDPED